MEVRGEFESHFWVWRCIGENAIYSPFKLSFFWDLVVVNKPSQIVFSYNFMIPLQTKVFFFSFFLKGIETKSSINDHFMGNIHNDVLFPI